MKEKKEADRDKEKKQSDKTMGIINASFPF